MKSKIKIMKPKPELADDDISSYMDFDGLLVKHANVLMGHRILKWIIGMTVSGLIIYGIYRIETVASEGSLQPLATESEPPQNSKTQPQIPIDSGKATISNGAQDPAPKISRSGQPQAEKIREEKAQNPSPDSAAVRESVYLQAEPVDGYAALYAYFNATLVYPPEALKDSIQGVVTVSFLINRDGQPEKIIVTQSMGEPFEKEARRLIGNMPPWKPATLNGKPMSSRVSIPLTFQIIKSEVDK